MTLVQVKTVWQKHEFDEYLHFMYKEFRFMVNEAIRIGHRLGLKTRNDFQQALYRRLKSDGMYAKYVQRVLDVALRLLRQHRTVLKKNPDAKLPYMKKAMLELDCQFYCIRDDDDGGGGGGAIRISLCLGEYIHIPLQRHMLERINGMKTGSIRITPGRLYISYSKIVKPAAEPSGWVGLDLNEENITAHDSLGNTTVFDIGRIRKAREKYVDKTSRFKRNDVRKRRKVTEKYGAKQKNLTDDVLHKVGPIHHTIRLWSHNGGPYGNTKDVQKGKRPRIQILGANECVAVLLTAKVHRVQGRMGGTPGDLCACTWHKLTMHRMQRQTCTAAWPQDVLQHM